VAYALSDDIKIETGSPSRSVTTSTVSPTLATAELLVVLSCKLTKVMSVLMWWTRHSTLAVACQHSDTNIWLLVEMHIIKTTMQLF